MKYEDFLSEAFTEFGSAHDTFKDSHRLLSYAHWFYNQSTGLLRLYNSDSDEIFFRYLPIGTFSTKKGTWMWDWHNQSSVEQNKDQALAIQEFGEQNGFEKLTTGYFESSEQEGWEFIAVAYKLLGGLCGYRANSETLYKYMLLLEEISSAETKKFEEGLIECSAHGKSRAAFVCQHLNTTVRVGFEEAFDSYPGMHLEEDDEFQAWCDECEKERLRTDGWNDESMKFAKIKMVCERCYFDIKKFQQKG